MKSAPEKELIERTAKVREAYDAESGNYVFIGMCPFCRSEVRVHNGEAVNGTQCEHFYDERHGCGGTIFVFRGEVDHGKER